jgi:hypothetical protein bfra3_11846
MVTLGLSEILVGVAAPNGTMPAVSTLKKIGKTYKDTAKLNQDAAEVTEHFEEGCSAPEVRKKSKKIPKLTFSIMDADIDALVAYIGGSKVQKTGTEKTKWAFDGSETVENRSILVKSEQGLYFEAPNADIEAVINADMSAKGIFLVDFTVTPLAVTAGKALRAYDPKEA